MSSIRFLISDSHDPWFNLAAEDYIFRNMENNQCILFLWRNRNTVVVGRAQNPWKECNTRRMERDGIKLARRSTGGGTVFHDLGNTCFTFLSRGSYIVDNSYFSLNVILRGLHSLGISANICGRNDIVVETNLGTRKISGSAYRQTNYGKLHHGTLLLDTDLDKLVYYLTPDNKKLESKGISSVRSRVINLIKLQPHIDHETLCHSLQESFFSHFKKRNIPEKISHETFVSDPTFLKLFSKQSSWDWNFGTAPNFTHQLNKRFHWGDVSLHFDIKDGIINRSCIFTDSLYPEPLEDLALKLRNLLYKSKDITLCCEKWMNEWIQYPELLEVSVWLIKNIS